MLLPRCRIMSLITSVALANDEKIILAHKLFEEWKIPRLTRWNQKKNNFYWAQAHWDCSHRTITRTCSTFESKVSYARAIATTYVKGRQVFWKSGDDADWKRASKNPPPRPRNGGPTRVFYNHNRDEIYIYRLLCLLYLLLVVVMWNAHHVCYCTNMQ